MVSPSPASRSSRPPSPDPELPVDTVLADRYRILGLIGSGRMGRVYAAEHRLLRKKLAIKVLHRDLLDLPEVVARFEREAMAAANIGHPNVVGATDFGRLPDGALFLVLEFVNGHTLREVLRPGALGVVRSVHIARQIASALAATHELGIVHRDLKPENVMLVARPDDHDFVKVLDFGIARFSDGKHRLAQGAITRPNTVFGTPEYMAPEQALGQSVDGRADLFSLGVMLFEIVTGARPFDAPTNSGILARQLSDAPPPLSSRVPRETVPASLESLIQRLLARSAADRIAQASLVVDALDAIAVELSPRSPSQQPPMRTNPPPAPARSTSQPAPARSNAPRPARSPSERPPARSGRPLPKSAAPSTRPQPPAKSSPTATKSNPIATKSSPTATKSNPIATKSNPIATKPNPTATKSSPTATKSNPIATKSNPIATSGARSQRPPAPSARASSRNASAKAATETPTPAPAAAAPKSSAADERGKNLPTFLPGDPLPAFDLTSDAAAALASMPRPGVSSVPPPRSSDGRVELPEAPTQLVLPIPSLPPESGASANAPPSSIANPDSSTDAEAKTIANAGPAPTNTAYAAPSASPSFAPPLASLKTLGGALKERGSAGLTHIGRSALAGYAQAVRYVDENRERLPRPVRAKLARVPSSALVSTLIAGAGVLLIALVIVGAFKKPREHGAAPSPSAAASAVAADSAEGRSSVKMAEPALRAVDEPANETDAQLDAARADLDANRAADAVTKVSRVLTAHPNLRNDERVGRILYGAAASSDQRASEAALSVLEGAMAGPGTEIVYRLARDRSVRDSTRRSAQSWIKSDAFSRSAPADLYTAVKLRYADSCDQRHRSLEVAGRVGKTHTLEMLRELTTDTGCGLTGKDDCYPCLRQDTLLKDAIAAIEARGKAQ